MYVCVYIYISVYTPRPSSTTQDIHEEAQHCGG